MRETTVFSVPPYCCSYQYWSPVDMGFMKEGGTSRLEKDKVRGQDELQSVKCLPGKPEALSWISQNLR